MDLRKLFIGLTAALILTHSIEGVLISTPWIGLVIWPIPLIIFNLKAWLKPTKKLYQVCGFIIMIYFMDSCLDVFGLPNASLLSWLELIEVVLVFFTAIYAAKFHNDVKST